MKKDTLTPEEERLLVAMREEYYAIGAACGPTDRKTTQATITTMYSALGRRAPSFVWCDSPLEALEAMHQLNSTQHILSVRASLWELLGTSLRNSMWDSLLGSLRASLWAPLRESLRTVLWGSLRESLESSLRASLESSLRASLRKALRASLWDSLLASLWELQGMVLRNSLWDSLWDSRWAIFYGQHESYWIAYYQFAARIGVQYDPVAARRLNDWDALARSCGWWLPYENICFVADRPSALHVDEQRRLHCADGPAMAFSDGYSLYAWHGVRVPGAIILHPEAITIKDIHNEANLEIRRIMIERYGWEKLMDQQGATLIAADTEPVGAPGLRGLFQTRHGRVLVCTCASSGHTFYLEVPPDIATCQQAANWLANTSHDDDLAYMAFQT